MISGLTRRLLLSGMVACSLAAFCFLAGNGHQLTAAPQPAATVNPFHGTYAGGFWGITPAGPYGGDVKLTVSTAGNMTLTLPGAASGTVASTGTANNVTGKLKVNGIDVTVNYTGKLVATKHPATGAYLQVVGSGTWKTVAKPLLPSLSGKWLIQRTATTP